MSRALSALLCLLLAGFALPAQAQTRAWLDRNEVSFGETVALNIQTDQPVSTIDTAPLQADFDIAGQTVRRSETWINGRRVRQTLLAFGLRPRAPGVLTIPPLRVGSVLTAPQRLLVKSPVTAAAAANSDVFVRTEVDEMRPYVQQAVGVTVRMYYGIPLLSGELNQEAPADASLRQVGEDRRYRRELGGRSYNVVERQYLLIPGRSGTLLLPGARFNGLRQTDFFKELFGNGGQDPIAAAAPARRLEVRPIPAMAPQPWLPLRALRLRYLRQPTRARVGEAVDVEIEMTADGATDAQLPPLEYAALPQVQVFANPPQADTQLVAGRPQASVRRSFSLVPTQPGHVSIPGPKVTWWDAVAGVERIARLPALELEVAPGMGGASASPDSGSSPGATNPQPEQTIVNPTARLPSLLTRFANGWVVALAGGLIGLGLLLWLLWRRRSPRMKMPKEPPLPTLAKALAGGDLAEIAKALTREANQPAGDLDAVCARLADPAQRDAVRLLQMALWGDGDPQDALLAMRRVFAKGAAWQTHSSDAPGLLPPLYPY